MIIKTIAAVAAASSLVFSISVTPSFANQEQAKANYIQADANQDKHLDSSEFETFINLNAEHKIGKANKVKRFGAYGKVFKKLDANSDGLVSPEEMAAQANG